MTTVYYDAWSCFNEKYFSSGGAFNYYNNLTTVYVGNTVVYWNDVFSGVSTIETIEFDSGSMLKEIGDSAFKGLVKLTDFDIPNTVTKIGDNAFDGCNLLAIVLPDGLLTIGNYAFNGCSGLTKVDLPNNVTEIGSYAFANCTSLEEFNINDDSQLNTILKGAFQSTALQSFKFTANLQNVENILFNGCQSLATVYYNITELQNDYKVSRMFENVTSLTTIIIEEGVMDIPAIFACASAVKSITIPSTVTNISSFGFGECTALETVNWNAVECKLYGTIFNSCENITTFVFSDSVEVIPDYLLSGGLSVTNMVIPAMVREIGEKCFWYCEQLTSVRFENPNGWYVKSSRFTDVKQELDSSDLADPTKAAQLLTDKKTYATMIWYRAE